MKAKNVKMVSMVRVNSSSHLNFGRTRGRTFGGYFMILSAKREKKRREEEREETCQ